MGRGGRESDPRRHPMRLARATFRFTDPARSRDRLVGTHDDQGADHGGDTHRSVVPAAALPPSSIIGRAQTPPADGREAGPKGPTRMAGRAAGAGGRGIDTSEPPPPWN